MAVKAALTTLNFDGILTTILSHYRAYQPARLRPFEDNIREWTGLEFAKSQRAVENRGKREETGCEIICGAPATLAVKG